MENGCESARAAQKVRTGTGSSLKIEGFWGWEAVSGGSRRRTANRGIGIPLMKTVVETKTGTTNENSDYALHCQNLNGFISAFWQTNSFPVEGDERSAPYERRKKASNR